MKFNTKADTHGMFMALSLREKNDVPVGLIQTAVEGTPVKEWCNEICAWLSDGEKPTGIRYAWKDCPMNICLYGKRGLSVIPFIKEWGKDAIYTGKICETDR
ncbi:hypothetical protein I230019B6_15740 [Firmicutes bacterium i23-0019-B6]